MKFIRTMISLAMVSTMAFSYNDTKVFQKIERDLDSIIVKDLNKKQLIF